MDIENYKKIIDEFKKNRIEFSDLIKCIECKLNIQIHKSISDKELFKLYFIYKKSNILIMKDAMRNRVFFMNVIITFAMSLFTIVASLLVSFLSCNSITTIKLNLVSITLHIIVPFFVLVVLLFAIFYFLVFCSFKKEINNSKNNYCEEQFITFFNEILRSEQE